MKTIYVTPDKSLQAILDSVSEPTTIYLESGVYHEKIEICKPDIKLIGKSRETTILSFNDYAKKPHADGREFNTFRTYTVCVSAEGCSFENLTVENTNTQPEKVGQCVALSVNAKSFYCKHVDLKSTQDTLFTAPFPDDLVIRYAGLTDVETYYDGFIPRNQLYMEGTAVHLFEDCRIYGNVDFIFGCARAFFRNCELISISDKRACGYVAAPAHPLAEPVGYCFIDCLFKNGGAAVGTNYLARPWRDFGKCNFINCRLENHLSPVLFDKWNDTYRNKTARFNYYNLECDFPLTPAPWSKELTKSQASALIELSNLAFSTFLTK